MRTVGERLAQAFTEVTWRDARVPVISNVTADPVSDAVEIRGLLARQVSAPVEWVASVEAPRRGGRRYVRRVRPRRRADRDGEAHRAGRTAAQRRRPRRGGEGCGGAAHRRGIGLMFSKILIANRGEIAVRILRACRDLGVPAVVAYSEADRDTLAVRLADEAVCIGPPEARKSYLNQPAVISAALITGADAIHPGYGFLSEDASFAEACVGARRGLHRSVGRGAGAVRQQVRGAPHAGRHRTADRAGQQGHRHRPARCAGTGRRGGLPGAPQAVSRRRRPRACGSCARRARWRHRCRLPARRHRRPSATTASTSRSGSRSRATSRCRCSSTSTATACTWASATAACSVATRRSSRRARRRRWTTRRATGCATSPSAAWWPPATRAPARSSSSSTARATSSSSRSTAASRSSTRSPRRSPAST